ncbi:SNF5-domain-containing protein [Ceratobasidium sp. AG-I]|nr:SNF5-domain-containing protein [Ceratobasidium sp. AG-I]
MNLTDQFEWDINNPDNSPEDFAEVYCRDLGLGGEFKTAVAHSIREQASVYQKSLFLVGHPFDGTPVADDELRTTLLPPIDHSFRFDRALLEQFTPQLNVLQEGEIERNEREREKELKRKRRQTRGRRGIALPDREAQKTHRTPVGFAEVEITPAQQAAQQQPTVSFRRAAAAAASLTIANLAANENGTPVPTSMHTIEKERLTPVLPQQQQIQQPKAKRQKTGILQPPPLPKSIFLSRAGAGGVPTNATGLEPAEASAARAEFGDGAPEEPASPRGGPNESVDSDGQAAMLRRVLEKEGAESTEGLHANMIDGTWHCSNCGCPETMAVGRRKGPLGQGTMCGECGKYWHKHRKPRPVEYSTSVEYHTNLKKQAKAKKRGTKATANANNSASPSKPSSARESERPVVPELLINGRDSLSPSPPPQRSPLPPMDPGSPDSTIGPDSPRLKDVTLPPTPAQPTPPEVVEQPVPPAPPSAKTNGSSAGTPPIPTRPPLLATYSSDRQGVPVPKWILNCLAVTQQRYPHDRVDIILKPKAASADGTPAPPEFRLKCLDCPGKLYTPGPEETLTNFEVHLKNRTHRFNVNRRVANEAAATGETAPGGERQTSATPSQTAPVAGAS